MSASLRKSITDLTRRRARTIFTVLTLAIAVASISLLAIPTVIDRTLQEEVRDGRLADVTLSMRPIVLTAEHLAALEAVPNVAAVEPRSRVETRVIIGRRRAPARVIGVRDFGAQRVDVVRLDSGAFPGDGEALADVQDANVGVYDGDAGDTVTLAGPIAAGGQSGSLGVLPVSGRGRGLSGGEEVQDDNVVVLYATAATVAKLSGERGYSVLALTLEDPGRAEIVATIEAVRRLLLSVPGFTGFTDLPEVRPPGDWPGKVELEKFTQLVGVITLLALLTAVVLISNTMTTLVAEQTGEIGIMRAIGARRRQVALVYVRTAVLFGALGALVGVALGLLLSNVLARSFGMQFWAVHVGFGVDRTVLVASIVVGLLAPPLAAMPAIRRAVRVDLREALESSGSAVGAENAGDRLIRRARFLPRTTQIGLRNVGRRRRRSTATVIIVALAVGNLLASMSVAAAATQASRTSWSDHLEDIRLWTGGRELFDERAGDAIRSTPGVAEVQPALVNEAALDGEDAFVWGMQQEPLFRYRLSEGRWFTKAEERARRPVGVIESILAETAGIEVGDVVTVTTAAGPARIRVVGIADNQQEDGTVLFVPLTTLASVLDRSGVTTYWVRATSSDETVVDRTASLLEDRLAALGFDVGTELTHVAERDEIAANRSLTTTLTVLGLLIVAMSMVGLANAITMSVIERTREVGILRCIGARARDVRRIFAAEGLALALAGWLLGIPVGYVLTRLLVRLIREVAEVEIPVVFPLSNVPLALAGTLVLAFVITLLPVRRAVRLRPGDALRYA